MAEDNKQVLPTHIGLILDGNRRWAKANGLPKLQGHRIGFENLKTVADHAFDRGIPYVTAFIFSTENWNRAKEEVGYLMDLAFKMITRDLRESYEKGMRLVWIGSEDGVSGKLTRAIRDAEYETRDNTRGTLSLCFNYGGRREIADAVKKLLASGVAIDDVDEDNITKHLYAPDIPNVDFLIRTSGEQRISNFMLWRAAYSELKFVDKFWPDFTGQDLDDAISDYMARNRRFGG